MKFSHPLTAALATALLLGGFCAGRAALAQPTGAAPRLPPAEALAACKSLAAGQACSFTSPRGPASGTCWAPEGRPLACRPKDAPPPPPGASSPKSR